MRAPLPALLGLLVACDGGGRIDIDDGETDTTAVVDTDAADTDGGGGGGTNGGGHGGTNGGGDTDPAGDTDPTPVDSDTDGGGGGGTNGGGGPTSPFDAPKLAWDGTVVVTNVPFVGSRNCIDRFTEAGDELFSGSRYSQLKSSCPTCVRFFEIRSTGSSNCLSVYEAGSWAGIELRPNQTVAVSTFYLDDRGQLVEDTKTPGALVGSTFTYTDSYPGLPSYKTTRERAEITLTPVP